MTDYKKYSLKQLENFLYDAMGAAEATPQEIYDVIKGVVEDNYYTYKQQTANAYELLALLNGNGKGHIKDYDDTELMPHLQCDGNDTSDECKNAWDDFWEQSYQSYLSGITDTPEEAEELRIEMENMRQSGKFNSDKDKVKKWVLPIDNDGVVLFPDDLLEAANLKEGDLIDWVDNGDGSFLLKKFERKTNTYDDMIAAQGYTMTDDGFWIKE
jgi:bifunctional DNA-binding transcriptional regulator/antitoxin component of YhaV-PrlF toxin-antitoxin module